MDADTLLKFLPAVTAIVGYIAGLFTDRIKEKFGRRWKTSDLVETCYAELAHSYAYLLHTLNTVGKQGEVNYLTLHHLNYVSGKMQYQSLEMLQENIRSISSMPGGFYIHWLFNNIKSLAELTPLPVRTKEAPIGETLEQLTKDRIEYLRAVADNWSIMIASHVLDTDRFMKHCSFDIRPHVQWLAYEPGALHRVLFNPLSDSEHRPSPPQPQSS